MNTPEQQRRSDALLGKDMDAYYALDASLHPEQRPTKCYVSPLVSNTPEYQRLAGLAIEAQLGIDKWSDTLAMLARAKDRLVGATEPEALPKLDSSQQELLLAAGKALGPFIGKAAGMKWMHQAEADRLRWEMRALELAARPTVPDSERFSGIGKDEFERQEAELQAMKGGSK